MYQLREYMRSLKSDVRYLQTRRCDLLDILGGDAQSWMNLQTNHDLRLVDLEKGKLIEKEIDPRAA